MDIVIMALSKTGASLETYVQQLAHWHHDEWLHLNPDATLKSRLKRYQESVKTDMLPDIFVAYNDDGLLGSATLAKDDMDTRAYLTPWLASLYVAAEYRSQGIASQLIKYVVGYAKQKQYKNIYLFTEDQTDFYQHRGWHFIESLEYRNNEVDLMSQKLT